MSMSSFERLFELKLFPGVTNATTSLFVFDLLCPPSFSPFFPSPSLPPRGVVTIPLMFVERNLPLVLRVEDEEGGDDGSSSVVGEGVEKEGEGERRIPIRIACECPSVSESRDSQVTGPLDDRMRLTTSFARRSESLSVDTFSILRVFCSISLCKASICT